MSALDVVTVVFGLIGGLSVTTKAVCEVVVGQLWDACKTKRATAGVAPVVHVHPSMAVGGGAARPVPVVYQAGGAHPV